MAAAEESKPGAGGGGGHHGSSKTATQLLEAREAHQESLRHQLLASIGKQVDSKRPTNQALVLTSPRNRVLPNQAFGTKRKNAKDKSPAPDKDAWPRGPAAFSDFKTSVLKGFGQGSRFLDDCSPSRKGAVVIEHSTLASPFSTTYPYSETNFLPSATDLRRRHPQATVDNNLLASTRIAGPVWTFGSAAVGGRFDQGASGTPRRSPKASPRTIGTRSRLHDFEALREELVWSQRFSRPP